MRDKRAEKAMLAQAHNPRNSKSPMEWGERGIRTSLKARRARARKPHSPEEAAANRLEEEIALRDAANALRAPDSLVAAAGEAIRPEFRLDFLPAVRPCEWNRNRSFVRHATNWGFRRSPDESSCAMASLHRRRSPRCRTPLLHRSQKQFVCRRETSAEL
jgi:hypothetical protein